MTHVNWVYVNFSLVLNVHVNWVVYDVVVCNACSLCRLQLLDNIYDELFIKLTCVGLVVLAWDLVMCFSQGLRFGSSRANFNGLVWFHKKKQ